MLVFWRGGKCVFRQLGMFAVVAAVVAVDVVVAVAVVAGHRRRRMTWTRRGSMWMYHVEGDALILMFL